MAAILTIIYLLASITFIIGLKMLAHPSRARRGNLIAAAGMAVAIAGTIFLYRDGAGNGLQNYTWIFSGLIIGGIAGVVAARSVKMTAMPEMVSLFNGMGGACAALISVVEFDHLVDSLQTLPGLTVIDAAFQTDLRQRLLIIIAGLVIGSISFAGSLVAWAKLSGKIRDFIFRGQHTFNIILLGVIFCMAVFLIVRLPPGGIELFYLILGLSLLYGIFFVLPIGGADMPVVISLLNSFTGIAAACGGFLYNNKAMLTGGILVGAAGTLLTILMCKAMNRSLLNVLVGAFGNSHKSVGESRERGIYKEIALSDAAMVMNYAQKIIIVPGYGLAVAQAQHTCHELEKLLETRGVQVTYAIHPVAGRMPGHMNVLLAEADVSYDKLQEMEQANDEFSSTDVVLVLGANDVVNPAAKNDPSSPIYGMPVLNVELAKTVIVNKRSMKPGYAGIENELFFQPGTSMLFGDAREVLQELIGEIKEL
ncbi:MAG: NAD(P)(+) transhydrogenase (Re/Si-specific) subunit beta [Chitinophagaceae bacterium]|nr:NAD(P)(+) transhydrogenase (Re/Si-specific) subunit beta [Chitinophagaceae bacterium]